MHVPMRRRAAELRRAYLLGDGGTERDEHEKQQQLLHEDLLRETSAGA
jgi:hypothetical protein